jgi:hypothetical protein
MRVITAFFGWYAPAVLPPACASFLPRLQEVRTIYKTCNQFFQIPPNLVVKSQAIDMVEVI